MDVEKMLMRAELKRTQDALAALTVAEEKQRILLAVQSQAIEFVKGFIDAIDAGRLNEDKAYKQAKRILEGIEDYI